MSRENYNQLMAYEKRGFEASFSEEFEDIQQSMIKMNILHMERRFSASSLSLKE